MLPQGDAVAMNVYKCNESDSEFTCMHACSAETNHRVSERKTRPNGAHSARDALYQQFLKRKSKRRGAGGGTRRLRDPSEGCFA